MFPVTKGLLGVNRLCGHEAQSGAPRPHPGARGVIGVSGWENRGSTQVGLRQRSQMPVRGRRPGAGCGSAFVRCGGGSSSAPCVGGLAGVPALRRAATSPRSSSSRKAAGSSYSARLQPCTVRQDRHGLLMSVLARLCAHGKEGKPACRGESFAILNREGSRVYPDTYAAV